MCRSTMERIARYEPLKIRGFYLRVPVAARQIPLAEATTLVFLPRIDGNLLEVNGSRIRAEAAAIVPLHRIRSAEGGDGSEAVFGSTDRVMTGEGVRFEAYIGDEKALGGVFRRGDGGWEMELRCSTEGDAGVAAAADVWVVGEKGLSMRQSAVGVSRRGRRKRLCLRLEEIPEEEEGCRCLCCEEEESGWEIVGSKEGDFEEEDVELGLEGVRWAVDVGIWVVCLGVGLWVSRSSYRSLRRKLL
ncbi:uncharacterized protein LOC122052803 [Zingiber officinale]|uniref:uncharacterized protein LOC122052803 n=1 Tax=Zingiber officinale TaxID=94328 RepID=UPI001C4CD30F|nr:uncharacterized protein LOC122052803 [Zingiber officinale]